MELVQEINWNDEAFRNLVLPSGRKMLLQSLVEAHSADLGFDDFVQGKGHGLVINLYGPPGVGKTLSAEATSEHVRRPLYVVGSGDLGTDATGLDANLSRIFDIATGWKAIVLIDEVRIFFHPVPIILTHNNPGGCLPRATLPARPRAQRDGRRLVSIFHK